jgi:hypothetical protein
MEYESLEGGISQPYLYHWLLQTERILKRTAKVGLEKFIENT